MTGSERDILRDLLTHYRAQARNSDLGRQLRNQARAAVEALVILTERFRTAKQFNALFEPPAPPVPIRPPPPAPPSSSRHLRVINDGKA